jgi:hypothetical protein
MDLHKYIEQHRQTVSAAARIFEIFKGQGVESFSNDAPTLSETDGVQIVTFRTIVQCAQDTWIINFSVEHHVDLSDSRIALSFRFGERQASFEATFRPYLKIEPPVTISAEEPQQLTNAFGLIRYTPVGRFEGHIFWKLVDRLAFETNVRNKKTTTRRRTRGPRTTSDSRSSYDF